MTFKWGWDAKLSSTGSGHRSEDGQILELNGAKATGSPRPIAEKQARQASVVRPTDASRLEFRHYGRFAAGGSFKSLAFRKKVRPRRSRRKGGTPNPPARNSVGQAPTSC